jgi:two-component system, sensor histidine kinase LadS
MRRLLLAVFGLGLSLAAITGVASEAAAVPAKIEPDVALLGPQPGDVSPADLASGALDAAFGPYDYGKARRRGDTFWLRLRAGATVLPLDGLPVLLARKGRHLRLEVFPAASLGAAPLAEAAGWSTFRGRQEAVFVMPRAWTPGTPLYLRVTATGVGAEELQFAFTALEPTLASASRQSQVLAAAVGALFAMALAALLIWFILPERLFVLYATLFSLQGLYVAFLSGQGFDWPLLAWATPLNAHAWNVPAALSGAAATLFVREIADLNRFSPRIYAVFGWLAVAFVVLAFANLAHLFGFGGQVASLGNLLFLGTAVFTLVVAFVAWRRGSRPAGWFLIAWGLLETATILTAGGFLFAGDDPWPLAWGLPLSMVAAAVFVALGVADRLREQRLALTEAERRAQTDPLTGVLNRRSLIERLDAASLRARARGLPISLLFIDLDHFKQINDTWGHLAGDACLLAVIRPIQAELRQSDVIGRYGGEEFVVILSSADAPAAQAIAGRILQRVADLRVEGFGPPIRLTCSIGVATSDELGVWGEQLISRADAAVYAAKNSGRNQVKVAALAA